MKQKYKIYQYIIIILLLFVSMVSCNDKDRIPYVPVNFQIYLNNPELNDLQTPGNYEYFTGGVRGIIIYCVYPGEYNAYERNCPYNPNSQDAFLKVDSTGLFLVCKSCDSKFMLYDGSLLQGPAEYNALKYYTYVQNDILYVYNDF